MSTHLIKNGHKPQLAGLHSNQCIYILNYSIRVENVVGVD
jgi:hypothetical protein